MTKETTIPVIDLIKGASYVLRIFARNRVGFGEPFVTEDPIVAGKRISKSNCFCLSRTIRSQLSLPNM